MRYVGFALLLLVAGVGVLVAQTGQGQPPYYQQELSGWGFLSCTLRQFRLAACVVVESLLDNTLLRRVTARDCRAENCEARNLRVYTSRLEGLQADRCELADLEVHNSEWRDLYVRNCELRDVRLERVDVYGGLGGRCDWSTWRSLRFYQNDFTSFAFDGTDFGSGRFQSGEFRDVVFDNCDFSNVRIDRCDVSGLYIDGIPVEKALNEYRRRH
ncbi:MAG: hypothetical protein N2512_10290 [Armatimonadetes bacterium]|nr:hypothetical protein [Armatimonadota bacterium]